MSSPSSYADQTARDHQQLKDAVANGAIESTNGSDAFRSSDTDQAGDSLNLV